MYPTKAVVTQVFGEPWKRLAEVTLPTHKAYADRLGAALVVIDKPRCPESTAYEKFQLFHVLSLYDRAVYVDADAIIRPDCPDLFLTVPRACVGGFNELADHSQQEQHLRTFCTTLGIPPLPCPYYLNAGVLVLSTEHRDLFVPPEKMPVHLPWPEQTHLNVRLLRADVPVCLLSWHYNCMGFRQRGGYLRESFIVHYSVRDMERRRQEAERDLAGWRELMR